MTSVLSPEDHVIGSILLHGPCIAKVRPVVGPEDFTLPANRAMYEAAIAIDDAGQPVDPVTLFYELERRGQLDACGGEDRMGYLMACTPTSLHGKAYALMMARTSRCRRVEIAGERIAKVARDGGDNLETVVADAEEALADAGRAPDGDAVTMREAINSALNAIERASEGAPVGLKTGFYDLDDKTNGLQPGRLIIVGGRPGTGKTAWALCVARHVAVALGKRVWFISLEMAADELALRLLCVQAHLDGQKVQRGDLDEDEWRKLNDAAGILYDCPIEIEDVDTISIGDVKARARGKHAHAPLDLLIVDYLQLIDSPSSHRNDNRVNEVDRVVRTLKALARDLRIPVIALAQINRNVEQRTGHRPTKADLRESGAIEQFADLICLLHREWLYNPDAPEHEAELIIDKQRNGPVGTVKLFFSPSETRFASMANEPF